MKQLLAILFATGFTYAVSLLAGKLVLKLLRVKLSRLEEHFLGFVLGAACLSTLVFVLTAAGLAHRGVFLAAGLVLCFISLVTYSSTPPSIEKSLDAARTSARATGSIRECIYENV